MVTLPENGQKNYRNFLKNCSLKTRGWNSMKIPYLLLYSFTFQMTPKTLKCVDQEKQDNFSCKHENTLKSMEFFESDEQLCLLTVRRSRKIRLRPRRIEMSDTPLIHECVTEL